jgi:hypothetical protein
MSHRREPSPSGHHGSAPDVGRGSAQARQAGDRAFGPPPPGPQWPGREPSEEERRGVPATDMEARTPLGVGISMARRGEHIAVRETEERRRAGGSRGRAGRPRGVSAPGHDTGVGDEAPIDEESPHLPTGDQAG